MGRNELREAREGNKERHKNYYEVLEIPTNATPEEVHDGYNRARNAYSQDGLALYSLMTNEECQEVLELIDEAYSILSEPNKRLQYDKARGIGVTYNPFMDSSRSASASEFKRLIADPIEQKSVTPGQAQNITKIVANKRFSLEFNQDNDFELEIEQASDFSGGFLKKIREYKQVDINRMADMTKISKTYIQNIEEEEFNKLPAPVYVRGFVYQYAKCLKLNPDLVANSFLGRMKRAIASKA